MTEFRFASDEHIAEITDFINYVFSQSARPHDFKALIPKVYADGRGFAKIHAIAIDDFRVRGVVAQHIINMSFAGAPIRVGYIGSVSTYPYTRGSGYMKTLMGMQTERAEREGVDIMLLGGQRQRYEYFGFSGVGEKYVYSINNANIRHALKNMDISGISFTEFADANERDIDAAFDIYSNGIVSGARSRDDFETILRTWCAKPYIIKRSGSVIGYLDVNGTDINELMLTESNDAAAVVKAWFNAFNVNGVHIALPPYSVFLNRAVAAFSENCDIHESEKLRIVNLKNVLYACLRLKSAYTKLSDGELTLSMAGGASVTASVINGEVSVSEASKAADVCLPRLDMQRYLFSFNRFSVPCGAPQSSWLPLPLFLNAADQF